MLESGNFDKVVRGSGRDPPDVLTGAGHRVRGRAPLCTPGCTRGTQARAQPGYFTRTAAKPHLLNLVPEQLTF